jgi:hypothetical protein
MRLKTLSPQGSSFFENLPNELLVIILESLDVPMFLRCRQVSKRHIYESLVFKQFMQLSRRFDKLVTSSISLEYRIELFAANLTDGLAVASRSTKSRLFRLKQHQTAWNNLTWSHMQPIPLTDTELKIPVHTSWELVGGMLGLADHRSIRFVRLPSLLRDIAQEEWRFDDIGFHIRDFTMDRSQDLLVLLERLDLDG